MRALRYTNAGLKLRVAEEGRGVSWEKVEEFIISWYFELLAHTH